MSQFLPSAFSFTSVSLGYYAAISLHSSPPHVAVRILSTRKVCFGSPRCNMSGILKKSAVLYHYPCPDGAFAALAAHLYFSSFGDDYPVLFFPNTVYNPVRVGDLPVADLDDVYLLDFIGPPGFVRNISSKVKRVVVLDHHKTALEMFNKDYSIPINVTRVIDMERSGATIAFDFFMGKLRERCNGTVSRDKYFEKLLPEVKICKLTEIFKYIEDADLWKWALPQSKAFSSGLKDMDFEYSFRLNPNLFEQAVDADTISNLRSELGNQLAVKSSLMKLRGIGAVVYTVPDVKNENMLKISLRSVDSEDTTVVSQEYGGGGHRNASSFMLSAEVFKRWKSR